MLNVSREAMRGYKTENYKRKIVEVPKKGELAFTQSDISTYI